MTRSFFACGAAAALIGAAIVAAPAAQTQTPADDALIKKAQGIHERVIALDTHDDINADDFTPERNYTQDLGNQVNLPKMVKGGLDAAFFVVYVGQGPLTPEGYDNAYQQAVAKFDAVHLLTEKIAPDKIELALTAADVRRINKAGKKVALIGVENGYSLGDASTAVKRVKEFYDRGARYMSLAHNGHSQLADSNTGEAIVRVALQRPQRSRQAGHRRDEPRRHHGRPVAPVEAVEPAGDCALEGAGDCVALVGARALRSQPRPRRRAASRDQEERRRRADCCVCGLRQDTATAFSGTARGTDEARRGIWPARGKPWPWRPGWPRTRRRTGSRTGRGCTRRRCCRTCGRRTGTWTRTRWRARAASRTTSVLMPRQKLAAIDKQFPPPPRANVKDFVDHIDYIVKKIGIDHVGISSDFDGGGGVDGWNDASETFNVTLELVRRGYTEDQIAKIWSGNLLRVMEEVRQVALKSQP